MGGAELSVNNLREKARYSTWIERTTPKRPEGRKWCAWEVITMDEQTRQSNQGISKDKQC